MNSSLNVKKGKKSAGLFKLKNEKKKKRMEKRKKRKPFKQKKEKKKWELTNQWVMKLLRKKKVND